jgi:hypothetical protein
MRVTRRNKRRSDPSWLDFGLAGLSKFLTLDDKKRFACAANFIYNTS